MEQQNRPQDFKLQTTGGRTVGQEVKRGIFIAVLLAVALMVWGYIWWKGQPANTRLDQIGTQASSLPGATTTPTPATAWDADAAYAKIQNGMTKLEVEAAIGKPAASCTESESEYIGKSEYCTYGNVFTDKTAISVVYSNGEVSSKTKSTY